MTCNEELISKAKELIEVNLDLEILLEEFGSEISLPQLSEGWSHDFADIINVHAQTIGHSPLTFVTQLLIKRLKTVKDQDNSVDSLITTTCSIQNALYLDHQYFIETITQSISDFSLYTLWKLHEKNVINIGDLLINVPSSQVHVVKDYITCNLTDLSCSCLPYRDHLLQDFGNVMLTSITEDGSMSLQEIAKDILLETIKRSYTDDTVSNDSFYSILDAIVDHSTSKPSSLEALFQFILNSLVSHPPFSEVKDMFPFQEYYKYTTLPICQCTLYTKIAVQLGANNCWKIITELVVQQPKVNLKTVLSFTACSVHCHSDLIQDFKAVLSNLVAFSLDLCCPFSLFSALLIARQAGLEGGHIFPSYNDWFKQTFGGSSQVLQARKGLMFLLKCLTDIVPLEPAYCLQAHIQYLPRKLNKCHKFVTDYIEIAKIRLHELNEPLSATPNEDGSSNMHELSLAEEEVKEMLTLFESSGCTTIPTRISEYSIFSKPYYTGRFLRVLLAPRHIPSPPDVREKLILALKAKEKMPSKMYAKYQRDCQKLSTSEGTSSTEDSSSSLSLLYEPLTKELDRMCRHYNDNKSSLESVMSRVSSAISSVISEIKKTTKNINPITSSSPIADLRSPGLTSWQIEIVDLLLEHICQIIVKLSQVLASGTTELRDNNFIVVSMFTMMLSSHPELHWPLLVRLWELIHLQLAQLTDSQLLSLSVLLCELYGRESTFRCLQIYPCCSPCRVRSDIVTVETSSDYSEFLLNSLRHHTRKDMFAAAKIYCHFIHHVLTAGYQGNVNSKQVMSTTMFKLQYLVERFKFYTDTSNFDENKATSFKYEIGNVLNKMSIINEIPEVASLLYTLQFDVGQWLLWELTIDTTDDFLSPLTRQSYRRIKLVTETGSKQVQLVLSCLVSLRVWTEVSPLSLCSQSHSQVWNNVISQCWNEGIHLIMEILLSLDTIHNDALLPLLPEAIKMILEEQKQTIKDDNMESKSIILKRMHVTATACMSCAITLPSYFMFANSPTSMSPCLLTRCINFIKLSLAPFLIECYLLPVDCAFHLLKGHIHCQLSHQSSRITEEFFHSSPTLLASLAYHWSHISKLLVDMSLTQFEELEKIDKFNKWINNSDVMSDDLTDWSSDHLAALSVCIYRLALDEKIDADVILVQVYQIYGKKCLYIIFDCCVRDLLKSLSSVMDTMIDPNSKTERTLQIAKCCLKIESSMWIVCQTEQPVGRDLNTKDLLDTFRKEFPSGDSLILLPLILFKVLFPVDHQLLKELTGDQMFVTFIFTTHSRLFAENENSNDFNSYQIYNPQYLRQCTLVARSLIQLAPPTLLKNCERHIHNNLKPDLYKRK